MELDLWAQLPSVLPEIGLTALAIIVLFADIYGSLVWRRNLVAISAVGMALLALVPLIWPPDPNLYENGALLWGGMVNYDPLAQIFKVMLLLGGAVTCLMAAGDKGVGDKGEFYLIVIVATLGGLMMSSASDLILVFVALETLSIPLYMLASFRRGDTRSAESGMKYFLYGAFASAIMLFGFSLLYGFTGTTSLTGIADAMQGGQGDSLVAVMTALVMVVVGFGFKISAVPFHFWTPDVYEGAPTPVTAFVSVSSKAASFALLVRFLTATFPAELVIGGVIIQDFWVNLLIVVSIVSMTLGQCGGAAPEQYQAPTSLFVDCASRLHAHRCGSTARHGRQPGGGIRLVLHVYVHLHEPACIRRSDSCSSRPPTPKKSPIWPA